MVEQSTRFPISGSSIRPAAFCRLDFEHHFSPLAAASYLNPCSMVAQHKLVLTLVSRIRPFPCRPPSQPSYAFHPHHGPLILRSHDTRGSRHWFQRLYHCFSAALLTFLRPRSTSLLAVLNATWLHRHVTRGSRHWFQPSSLCISALAATPSESSRVTHASGILTTWHKRVQTCLYHVCTVYVQCYAVVQQLTDIVYTNIENHKHVHTCIYICKKCIYTYIHCMYMVCTFEFINVYVHCSDVYVHV
jgi:hypothetical protein